MQDSSTVNRENAGFAAPEEYRAMEEALRRHQDHLYFEAERLFEIIEAKRRLSSTTETDIANLKNGIANLK